MLLTSNRIIFMHKNINNISGIEKNNINFYCQCVFLVEGFSLLGPGHVASACAVGHVVPGAAVGLPLQLHSGSLCLYRIIFFFFETMTKNWPGKDGQNRENY